MLSIAAAPLLAMAAAAGVEAFQLGLREETRGFAAGPAGHRRVELDLHEVDPTLGVEIGTDARTVRFQTSYAPRFFAASEDGHFDSVGAPSGYHAGSLALIWQVDERLLLSLSGLGAYGFREISPLSQGIAPGPVGAPSAPPALQPNAGVRAASYAGAGAGATSEIGISARWRTNLSASYNWSEGRTPDARVLFPQQRSYLAELRTAFAATPIDNLSLLASAAGTHFEGGRLSGVAALSLRWDRALAPGWSTGLAGGIATSSQRLLPDASDLKRVSPVVEIGVARAGLAPSGEARPGWNGRAQLRLAPYVDPYTAQTLTRAEGNFELGWISGERFRVAGALGAGGVVLHNDLGSIVAVGELGLWRMAAREVETGLLLRAGWLKQGPLAATAPWQWGIAFAVRWAGRTARDPRDLRTGAAP
jgi:hypothetical protein